MTAEQQKIRSFRMELKSLIRNTDLSAHARFLWVVIDSYSNKFGEPPFPAVEKLAESAGHPVRWVFRYLDELKEKGFVEVKKKRTNGGWVNLYVLRHSARRT